MSRHKNAPKVAKTKVAKTTPPVLASPPPLDLHPLSPYATWAGERNRNPILDILLETFPKTAADVLEIASGSGMHLHHFAPYFPHLTFHPSDADEEVFEHIQLLTGLTQLNNVQPPIQIDLAKPETWLALEPKKFAAIFLINLFQVVSLDIADGLARITASYLEKNGALYIYGPFKASGEYTAPSNQAFDDVLQGYGLLGWGLKDIDDINDAAEQYGLKLKEIMDMPANNFLLIYEL